MTIQKTYTRKSDVAYPGLLGDIDNNDVDSFAAEGDVEFGLGVFRGTDPETQAKVAGSDFLGVAVRDHAVSEGYLGKYGDKRVMGVIRRGPVWVELETTGAIGDALTVDITSGRIGTNAVAGNYIAINAILETPATAVDQLVLINLQMNK